MRYPGIVVLLMVALIQPAESHIDTAGTVQAAEGAVRDWLALVDSGHYDASWDSAAGVFRSEISKVDWKKAVSHARAQFEPFSGRKLLGAHFTSSLPGAPPGEYVVLAYESQGSGNRSVIETVTPRKEPDGRWRVSGYFIREQ